MKLTIGPDRREQLERSEREINERFNAPHATIYAIKVLESQKVLSGQISDVLSDEAAMRGVPVCDLAQQIYDKNQEIWEREFQRINEILILRKNHG